ncbi:L,D-transpeptidase family protein [Streptomyces sp. URMC 123]|uniref:L,D-transpeptidase family protein n=1 Tax=Streptomyces sp. URMC 123 TaxID=3423403 RepID=UPI003F1A7A5D
MTRIGRRPHPRRCRALAPRRLPLLLRLPLRLTLRLCLCAALLVAPGTTTATATVTANTAEPPPPAWSAASVGARQLITAEAPGARSTTGTLSWWDRRPDGGWARRGRAPARFGAGGLVEGHRRKQGTATTPTGLYALPFGFGLRPAPPGTSIRYRRVTADSWWCQDPASAAYNRWVAPLPRDCAPGRAERLASYRTQYAHALVVAFNYDRPVRGRGAGIFLHVNGRGATAGCVSVPADTMARLLAWVDPRARPHIAIGTPTGPTAIPRP